jgi:hypothetical protein
MAGLEMTCGCLNAATTALCLAAVLCDPSLLMKLSIGALAVLSAWGTYADFSLGVPDRLRTVRNRFGELNASKEKVVALSNGDGIRRGDWKPTHVVHKIRVGVLACGGLTAAAMAVCGLPLGLLSMVASFAPCAVGAYADAVRMARRRHDRQWEQAVR